MRATHNYTRRDSDELTFEKGETIDVLPFDDPDDQVMSGGQKCVSLEVPRAFQPLVVTQSHKIGKCETQKLRRLQMHEVQTQKLKWGQLI